MKITQLLFGIVLLITTSILTGCEDGGTGALPHHEFFIVNKTDTLTHDAVATLVGDLVSIRTIYESNKFNRTNSPTSFEITFNDSLEFRPSNGSGDPTKIEVTLSQSNLKVGTIAMDSLRLDFTGGISTGSNSIEVTSASIKYYSVDAKVTITEVFVHQGVVLGIRGYANGTFRSSLPSTFKPGDPFPPGYDPTRVTLLGHNLLLHSMKFRIGRFTAPTTLL